MRCTSKEQYEYEVFEDMGVSQVRVKNSLGQVVNILREDTFSDQYDVVPE